MGTANTKFSSNKEKEMSDIPAPLSDWIELIQHPRTFNTACICLVYIGNAFKAARFKAKATISAIDREKSNEARATTEGDGVMKIHGRHCYKVEISPDNDPEADRSEWITASDCGRYSRHLAALINSYDGRHTPESRWAPDFEGLLVGISAMMKDKKEPYEKPKHTEETKRKVKRLTEKFFAKGENGALENGAGSVGLAQLLLNVVVYFDKSFQHGKHSPLHEAIKANDLDALIMMLSHEVNVDSVGNKGDSALQFAVVEKNRSYLMKVLILFGADHRRVSIEGRSAEELCKELDLTFIENIGTDYEWDTDMIGTTNVLKVAATRSRNAAPLSESYKARLLRSTLNDDKISHLLSLDGGGIRGLVLTTVLDEIERVVPNFLEKVSWTAGTSTGAILALALAQTKTIAQCRNIYFKFKDAVFYRTRGIFYDHEVLERFLDKTYGKGGKGKPITMFELGEKCKKKIIATSVDKSGQTLDTALFKTYKIKEDYKVAYEELTGQRAIDEARRAKAEVEKEKLDKMTKKEKEEWMLEKKNAKKSERKKRCDNVWLRLSGGEEDEDQEWLKGSPLRGDPDEMEEESWVCVTEFCDYEKPSRLEPSPKIPVAYAARCSSAAPMYFHSPKDMNEEDEKKAGDGKDEKEKYSSKYLDGGILNNNPTMVLLHEWMHYNEAQKTRLEQLPTVQNYFESKFLDKEADNYEEQRTNLRMKQALHADRCAKGEVRKEASMKLGAVVSIGTGQYKDDMPRGPSEHTVKEWLHDAKETIRFLLRMKDEIAKADGQVVEQSNAFTQSHDGSFFRFQPELNETIELDETDNRTLIDLMWTTKEYMRRQIKYLEVLNQIMNNPKEKKEADDLQ